MFFGISPCMSHTLKFWHTYVIVYSNFMVIVEPWVDSLTSVFCQVIQNTAKDQSLNEREAKENKSLDRRWQGWPKKDPKQFLFSLAPIQSTLSQVSNCHGVKIYFRS